LSFVVGAYRGSVMAITSTPILRGGPDRGRIGSSPAIAVS
jgi:hypothetical protein